MMYRTLTLILKPTEAQEQQFLNYSGATRFVWNYLLDVQKARLDLGEYVLKAYDLGKLIVSLKKAEGTMWLADISHHTLLEVARQNAFAFRTYFAGLNGFPRYKSRNKSDFSFSSRTDRFHFNPDNTVHLDKIGNVAYTSRLPNLKGIKGVKIGRVTIKRRCNKWVALVCISYKSHIVEPEVGSMGIDVGIHNLVTAYWDGNARSFGPIRTNKYKKAISKLAYVDSILTRKFKAHKRDIPLSKKLQRYLEMSRALYQKQRFRRVDYIRNIVAYLLSFKPSRVVTESLDVHDMQEDTKTSRYMFEASLALCINAFRAACEWREIPFVQASKDFPSTQLCSSCGNRTRITLAERVYTCPHCGMALDRDINAAKNLSKWH